MTPFYDLHSALKQPLAVEALHLDRNQLKEVPESILAFKNLRLLNLSHNQLEHLPAWLDQFSYLQTLQLTSNQLQDLPETLRHCPALEVLDLRVNQFKVLNDQCLPISLVHLEISQNRLPKLHFKKTFPKLKILKININRLATFPKIKHAPNLSTLELSINRIKNWPKTLQPFSNLEKLTLGRNLLQLLPNDITQLPRLKYLDLSSNKLTKLSDSLGYCTDLRNLNLADNQLQELPSTLGQLSWLVDLNLSENQFSKIPQVVQQLQRLDRLDLSRNQLGPRLKFLSSDTLRVLDLSHNPIESISQLPLRIKQLSLRKMPLEKLVILDQLQDLEQLDLRLVKLETLPDGLFYLSRLKVLKGLLGGTEKQHLLQLLNHPLTPPERQALFYFWQGEGLPNQAILLKGLALSFPYLSKKITAQLLRETKAVYPNLPEETLEVQIVGRLTSSKVKLKRMLNQSGLHLSEQSNWCILGGNPFPALNPAQTYHFFNEAQLLTFLNQKKQPNLSQSQYLKLERLLLHANPKQVKMALLLLKKQSIDSQLLPALIAAWKLQTDPKLRRQLRELAQQNQHPNYELLHNGKLLAAEVSTVFQWLENAGFDPQDFKRWESFFEKK